MKLPQWAIDLRNSGARVESIARALGRHPETVRRELNAQGAVRYKSGPRRLDRAPLLAMHRQGASYTEIGRAFGRSRQWAQQMLRDHVGFPKKCPQCGAGELRALDDSDVCFSCNDCSFVFET